MTPDQTKEFAKCLFLLGETFNEPVSELRVEAYWQALCDLELSAIQGGTYAALRSCTFFPKPAELRKFIEGTADDRAELAWVEAQRQARKVGAYAAPVFTDPSVRAAIDACGGWRAFCLSEDEPTYRAVLFKRTYTAMARRAETDRMLSQGAAGSMAMLTEG